MRKLTVVFVTVAFSFLMIASGANAAMVMKKRPGAAAEAAPSGAAAATPTPAAPAAQADQAAPKTEAAPAKAEGSPAPAPAEAPPAKTEAAPAKTEAEPAKAETAPAAAEAAPVKTEKPKAAPRPRAKGEGVVGSIGYTQSEKALVDCRTELPPKTMLNVYDEGYRRRGVVRVVGPKGKNMYLAQVVDGSISTGDKVSIETEDEAYRRVSASRDESAVKEFLETYPESAHAREFAPPAESVSK